MDIAEIIKSAEIKDIQSLLLSDSYQVRLLGEYLEANIRAYKLDRYINDNLIVKKVLNGQIVEIHNMEKPEFKLQVEQLSKLLAYIKILKARLELLN